MKKLFFGTMLFLAFTLAAQAQGPNKERRQEKIEAYKIAFFTEKLQLTPDESKSFWPLFNKFEDERDAVREKYDLDGKRFELMSDKEVETSVMNFLDGEEQIAKLRREYVLKFKEVLPIRKVAMLQRLDREFKQYLLEELKKRKEERLNGGGRRN